MGSAIRRPPVNSSSVLQALSEGHSASPGYTLHRELLDLRGAPEPGKNRALRDDVLFKSMLTFRLRPSRLPDNVGDACVEVTKATVSQRRSENIVNFDQLATITLIRDTGSVVEDLSRCQNADLAKLSIELLNLPAFVNATDRHTQRSRRMVPLVVVDPSNVGSQIHKCRPWRPGNLGAYRSSFEQASVYVLGLQGVKRTLTLRGMIRELQM
jgi:hypothetical protein